MVPKLTFLLATEGWSGQPYTNKLCPNTIETHVVTKTGVPLTPTMSPRGSQLNESDQSERCKKEGGMTRVRRSWVQILVQPKDCFAKSRLKVTCLCVEFLHYTSVPCGRYTLNSNEKLIMKS